MNALPLISHHLLVAAVAEQRSTRGCGAVRKKPIVIECDSNAVTSSADIEEATGPLRAVVERQVSTRGLAGAAWPF
ncbi:MAG: hypothetical protein HY298_01970 [Verrucomicrobia bacterium]|nr:hypothetical protein [Verrucomicrobiota bacterium]